MVRMPKVCDNWLRTYDQTDQSGSKPEVVLFNGGSW